MAVRVEPPFKRIELLISWEDGTGTGTKGFANVHELAFFLKDNPEFAKALGYVEKNKVIYRRL